MKKELDKCGSYWISLRRRIGHFSMQEIGIKMAD
jgi:hypothetical protein